MKQVSTHVVFDLVRELCGRAGPGDWPVALATSGRDGRPSVRTVLLKEASEQGFVFFSSRRSRKGRQLSDNPHAALCAFFPGLGEQLVVEGEVRPLDGAASDAYWSGRPRASQLSAIVSHQSAPIDSREELERRLAEADQERHGQVLLRPEHWTGFVLSPHRIELWRGDPSRLNHRQVFEQTADGWLQQCLQP